MVATLLYVGTTAVAPLSTVRSALRAFDALFDHASDILYSLLYSKIYNIYICVRCYSIPSSHI